MRFLTLLFFSVFCVWTSSSMAQDFNQESPVEITADDAIEWLREENLYRARGNALATQGDTNISSDILSAFYHDDNTQEVTEIQADGNVTIENQGQKIVGDKAIYNVQQETIRITGSNLAVTTPQAAITAQESIEYYVNQRQAIARGQAEASDGTHTIKADILKAWLMNDSQGKTTLKKVTAEGGLIIETPTEVITGSQGTYDAIKETATVEGSVKITRDDNQLNGDRAIVNLKTGVSQLLASPNGDQQRVRALFYPKSNATPLEAE